MTPFRKAGLLLAALAMFSLAGGHWAVLQGIAWAGMWADYAQASGDWVTAAQRTFDGAHPCPLCREIAAAKNKGKDPSQPASSAADKKKAGKDAGALVPAGLAPRLNAGAARWPRPIRAGAAARQERPPVPPPRSAALA